MDPLTWTASAVGQTLVAQLLDPPSPGAQLTDKPIHLNTWVAWRQADREVTRRGLHKILRQVVKRTIAANPVFSAVPPREAQLVIANVADDLMSIEAITMDRIQASHLDSRRLARTLESKNRTRKNYGSSAGLRLHDDILIECCKHLIDYFTRRPEFIPRTLVEQSQILGSILDHLPDPARQNHAYEIRYKQGLVRIYDTVRLFGLGLPPSHQTYKLSTAYVSLSVKEEVGTGEHSRTDLIKMTSSVIFNDILATKSRILLEGPAGAGKTTLLTRLALHICDGDLPAQLAGWGQSVPFLLRLRSFYSDYNLTLPNPATFVTATTPPVPSEPSGWTASLLDEGRAVVLIDGIDEVPRPSALDAEQQNLLRNLGFIPALIEPMTPPQVNEFIERWHQAAVGDSQNESEYLQQRANALKDALLRRRALSRLATNPLMCAMLCALNRNHNSNLPPGRIALYRAALAMLLGRRDQERQIPPGVVQITEDQAQALLAPIALWMTLNGRRTISYNDAMQSIIDVLPRLRIREQSQESASPKRILQFLLERTGVLREPAIGMLEFRHSSFQDYFAAKELIRGRSLDHLLRNAHDPLYHDVVIMAVGQSQDDPERQRQVLGGLIERAKDATYRVLAVSQPAADAISLSRGLWLLAAACIADVEMVSPDLASQIQIQTKKLLPPADVAEAEIVARAGEFVIDLLAEITVSQDISASQICGIIRVATLMGGDTALTLLKRFRTYPDQLVQTQIVDGWFRSRYPERYADEILSDASLEDVDVRITDKSYIRLLPRLKNLRRLHISCSMDETDLSVLASLEDLLSLDISDTEVTDITPLAVLSNLEDLILQGNRICDLTVLSELTGLKALNLARTPTSELGWISGLRDLTALDISDTLVTDLTPLEALRDLEILDLSGSSSTEISAISRLERLEWLSVERTHVTKLDALSTLKRLKILKASRTSVADLRGLVGLTELRVLEVRDSSIADLWPLVNAEKLETLDVRETAIRSLVPLARLQRLQFLDLMFTRVDDLEPLEGLTGLKSLNVRSTGVRDLTPLAGLPNLRDLDLRGTQVDDVSALRNATRLRRINLMGTMVSDISPLAGLQDLRKLDIVGTQVRDVSSLNVLAKLHIEAILPLE